MKTLLAGMTAHLKLEVTTLCTCWRIIRNDGQVFGFTDHDQSIYWGNVVYESDTGYNRSAISGDESFSVDNLNVTGFLESDKISENDLRNGLFDYAKVFIFALNWMDPTGCGAIPLRRGWLGEVTLDQNGTFETEVRGLHQALSINYMEAYQPECRADFCDGRCKLSITDYTYPGTVYSASARNVFQATQLPAVPTTGTTSVGAHRYWRIKPTGTYQTDYAGFAEIVFFDQSNAIISGGDSSSNSDRAMTGGILGLFGTTYHSGAARDGDINTAWICKQGETATCFWQIDFGSPEDVKSLIMTNPSDYTMSITAFDLEYSDNGSDYFPAYSFSCLWTGASQEETFTMGANSGDPVDFPTSQTALPPPFTGASTYVGGTITFTTGPNRGKTLEIVGFDTPTNTVTLIEGFPYPIGQGDKFNIAQGCDKAFTTCKVYNNVNNFRGEPQVPGQDVLLNYPDATS